MVTTKAMCFGEWVEKSSTGYYADRSCDLSAMDDMMQVLSSCSSCSEHKVPAPEDSAVPARPVTMAMGVSGAVLFWIGMTAAAISVASAWKSVPPNRRVTASKTQYNHTVYWQGRSEQPGDVDAYVLLQGRANAPSEGLSGQLVVWDSWLTTLQDPNSTRVGHGRGLSIYDWPNRIGQLMYWEAFFDRDIDFGGLSVKSGSALFLTGFHYAADAHNGYEVVTVGGTGSFQYCQGYDVEHRVSEQPTVIEKIEFHIICDSF